MEDREAPTISEMSIPVSEMRYWVAVTGGASLSRAPIVFELYGNNDEYISRRSIGNTPDTGDGY